MQSIIQSNWLAGKQTLCIADQRKWRLEGLTKTKARLLGKVLTQVLMQPPERLLSVHPQLLVAALAILLLSLQPLFALFQTIGHISGKGLQADVILVLTFKACYFSSRRFECRRRGHGVGAYVARQDCARPRG